MQMRESLDTRPTWFGSKFCSIRNLLWATTWLKVSGLLEPQMAQASRIARST